MLLFSDEFLHRPSVHSWKYSMLKFDNKFDLMEHNFTISEKYEEYFSNYI